MCKVILILLMIASANINKILAAGNFFKRRLSTKIKIIFLLDSPPNITFIEIGSYGM